MSIEANALPDGVEGAAVIGTLGDSVAAELEAAGARATAGAELAASSLRHAGRRVETQKIASQR